MKLPKQDITKLTDYLEKGLGSTGTDGKGWTFEQVGSDVLCFKHFTDEFDVVFKLERVPDPTSGAPAEYRLLAKIGKATSGTKPSNVVWGAGSVWYNSLDGPIVNRNPAPFIRIDWLTDRVGNPISYKEADDLSEDFAQYAKDHMVSLVDVNRHTVELWLVNQRSYISTLLRVSLHQQGVDIGPRAHIIQDPTPGAVLGMGDGISSIAIIASCLVAMRQEGVAEFLAPKFLKALFGRFARMDVVGTPGYLRTDVAAQIDGLLPALVACPALGDDGRWRFALEHGVVAKESMESKGFLRKIRTIGRISREVAAVIADEATFVAMAKKIDDLASKFGGWGEVAQNEFLELFDAVWKMTGNYALPQVGRANVRQALAANIDSAGDYSIPSGSMLVDANGQLTAAGWDLFTAWRVAFQTYLGGAFYPNAEKGLADAATKLATKLEREFFKQYYARVAGDPNAGLVELMMAWPRVAASMQFHVAAMFSLFRVEGTAYKGMGGFTYARIKWIPTHSDDIPVEFIARFQTDADLDATGFHVYAKWDATNPNNKRWVGNLISASGNAMNIEDAWSNIVEGRDVLVGAVNNVPTYAVFGGTTQLVLADLADPPDPLPAGYPW